ncbi:MAG: formylglycine-generating enzyme family protein [Candidatus Thermoplasmatota archaeon]|nr:formylglycine-generating enzyme family protein [Candidatus Thermoplasmatota archaeon]
MKRIIYLVPVLFLVGCHWIFNSDMSPSIRIVSPNNGSVIASLQPEFCWESDYPYQKYELQIAKEPETISSSFIFTTESTSFIPDINFFSNETYCWRVRGITTNGDWTSWTDIQAFEVLPYSEASLGIRLIPVMNTGEENSFNMDTYYDPPHQLITLTDGYAIGETEITQYQYQTMMDEMISFVEYGSGDDIPVYFISWWEAAEFCNRLSIADGLTPSFIVAESRFDFTKNGYRLPTMAEWEYATNSDDQNFVFAGSNILDDVGWYADNSNSICHPVKQKKPNKNGIYDLSGNLWEWCADWYSEDYYVQYNPVGPDTGDFKICKGGAWDTGSSSCFCKAYSLMPPGYTVAGLEHNIGFRIVRPLPQNSIIYQDF